uniref:Laccase n=1 Tax=Fagus sylvatica TaxID=28930 RepID=A0A2N9IRH0_FAGSY
MARFVALLACALALLATSMASAAIVEHSFSVQNLTVRRLCNEQVITAVNGCLPGPTIRVREGDILVVHVFNKSPYNITIHWHGIFQLLSGWADGPEYVTQCPILPGNSYIYKFKITGQEGTLWWHAHSAWLRATVHGALIIHPKSGRSYPFPKPHKEVPILLGEWWNANVVDVENEGLASGGAPNNSDAYTINGKPGDLYQCSQNQTYKLKVVQGKTYMLRIINAALNNQLFFKIANHKMTVVAVDAGYTKPYITDVVVVAPGQTTDVLVTADQTVGSYYMAATPYASAVNVSFDDTTTRGIIEYEGATSATPLMPVLPATNDTSTAHKFFTNLTGLAGGPHWVPVPRDIDEHMFVTFGLNLAPCEGNGSNATSSCQGPLNHRLSASMNNVSFVLPSNSTMSMLQAFFYDVSGVYTTDFPSKPPVKFDYTNPNISLDESLIYAPKATKVKKLKYNSTVEIVLQNTAFVGIENHPIHLHGFNFHVLAQGFGNYDSVNDQEKFNLINPQARNTIAVPVGGWAVIRFQANNPGIWLAHCHLDVHLPWGLAMAFEVENGPTLSSTLPPPPIDLPQC